MYQKPPIQEVIFEIRPEPSSTPELSAIEDFIKKLPKEYVFNDEKSAIYSHEFSPDGEKLTKSVCGYQARSRDNKNLVKALTDVLVFIRYPEYLGGDNFWTDFSAVHEAYTRTVYNNKANYSKSRVGLRFINKLDIPEGENINNFVNFPKGLDLQGEDEQAFLITTQIYDKQTFVVATIRYGVTKNEGNSIHLDTDTFIENVDELSKKELQTIYNELRQKKNMIFEKIFTDRAKESFK